MDILIKADNPKGLPYEFLVDSPEKAKGIIRNIAHQGGINLTVNGRLVPAETLAFIASV